MRINNNIVKILLKANKKHGFNKFWYLHSEIKKLYPKLGKELILKYTEKLYFNTIFNQGGNMDITVNRINGYYLLSTIVDNQYFKHKYSCYDVVTAKKLFTKFVKRELAKCFQD